MTGTRPPNCKAYRDRGTDTIVCDRCGLQWSVDDIDPPDCPRMIGRSPSHEDAAMITATEVNRLNDEFYQKLSEKSTPMYGCTFINKMLERLK